MLEMNVEVERLKHEILFSQPPQPLQYDLLPRRSPAAGTGLDESGVPHAVTQQTELEGTFLFKPVSMAFCTLIASRSRRGLSHFKQASG